MGFTHRSPGADGGEDLYYLRREDQALGKDIRMLGGRIAYAYDSGVDYAIEGALQRGDFAAGVGQEAFGGKAEIGYARPGSPLGLRPFVGYVALSGDLSMSITKHEGWDVFYGGWPQYGDLLAWTYLNLGPANGVAGFDPGYAAGSSVIGEVLYANLLMPSAGATLAPHPAWSARLSFSRLRAHHSAAGSDAIGDYYQLSAKHRYSENLVLSIYLAHIQPGGAYGPNADAMHEYFWEAKLIF